MANLPADAPRNAGRMRWIDDGDFTRHSNMFSGSDVEVKIDEDFTSGQVSSIEDTINEMDDLIEDEFTILDNSASLSDGESDSDGVLDISRDDDMDEQGFTYTGSGDIALDGDNTGSTFHSTITHELGHSAGLWHPFEKGQPSFSWPNEPTGYDFHAWNAKGDKILSSSVTDPDGNSSSTGSDHSVMVSVSNTVTDYQWMDEEALRFIHRNETDNMSDVFLSSGGDSFTLGSSNETRVVDGSGTDTVTVEDGGELLWNSSNSSDTKADKIVVEGEAEEFVFHQNNGPATLGIYDDDGTAVDLASIGSSEVKIEFAKVDGSSDGAAAGSTYGTVNVNVDSTGDVSIVGTGGSDTPNQDFDINLVL